MSEPVASRPHIPGYGLPETTEGLLEWSYVENRLEESMHYWLATTGSGGPHVNAIWGVWWRGALYFGGSPEVRWARNLGDDPRIAAHLEDGEKAVILEGTVEKTSTDPDEEVTSVMNAYRKKYKMDHPAPFWRLTPRRAFAWTDFAKDATRWRFPS